MTPMMHVARRALAYVRRSSTAAEAAPPLTYRRLALALAGASAVQGGVILALFVAFFPFCLFGLPEWTCLESPFYAAPVIMLGISPVFFAFCHMESTIMLSLFAIAGLALISLNATPWLASSEGSTEAS